MIRTRRNHWERRRYWEDAIGWIVAALIPVMVAVVVALTKEG